MATYKFQIKKEQIKKDGTVNIKLRLTQFRKIKYIPTPFYVAPDLFDNEQGKVNHKHKLHLQINRELNKYLLEFENKLFSIDNFDNLPLDFLLKEFERINKGDFVLLEDYVNKILPRIKSKSERNAEIYTTTLNVILSFRNGVYLQGITREFLFEFERYLISKGNAVNTIGVYLRTLRSIINKAIDDDYLDLSNYPFRKFKIRKEATKPRSLELWELQKLIQYEPINKYEQRAKDIFILMFCLIGINMKDLFYCKKSTRVDYRRSKQKGLFSIEIQPQAQEIISRYADDEYLLNFCREIKDHTTLTKKTNTKLKLIAKKIGINENISCYYSRHTWAFISLNKCGIDKEVIAYALGHSRTSTTDIYARIEQNRIDQANKTVIDFVFNDY